MKPCTLSWLFRTKLIYFMRHTTCDMTLVPFPAITIRSELVTIKQNNLAGTWRLIEYSDFGSLSNKWIHSYGEHQGGYFTYMNSGIVNLNISAENTLYKKVSAECNISVIWSTDKAEQFLLFIL